MNYSRSLQMQRKRIKKEKRQDIALFSLLVIGLIVTMILSMKLGQKSITDCMNAGHTQEYCERGL